MESLNESLKGNPMPPNLQKTLNSETFREMYWKKVEHRNKNQ